MPEKKEKLCPIMSYRSENTPQVHCFGEKCAYAHRCFPMYVMVASGDGASIMPVAVDHDGARHISEMLVNANTRWAESSEIKEIEACSTDTIKIYLIERKVQQ